MNQQFIIKGGHVITETGPQYVDIYVEGEKIKQIGKDLVVPANTEKIDASGYYVIPGGIDPHTHMDLPFKNSSASDSFSTGTAAALHGGTTTIIDFANQTRGKPLQEAVDHWQQLALNQCHCDYAFHATVTDVNTQTLAELPKMINQGITSFKTFMAYPQMQLKESDFRTLFQEVKKLGGIITTHAENGPAIDKKIKEFQDNNKSQPRYHALARSIDQEEIAVEQLIHWALEEKSPIYIVHMTSAKAIDLIRMARQKGQLVYGETCPQYLILDDKCYDSEDFLTSAAFILSPPIRSRENVKAMWEQISYNDGIFTVGTDHCPFTLAQRQHDGSEKFWCVPNGIGGVEHRLQLLFSEGVLKKRLSLERWVDINSTQPAKLFGLYPRKGVLKENSDADIVLWNPRVKYTLSAQTHHMNCDHSPYEGMELQGNAETVWLRGKKVINQRNLIAVKGYGQYLHRAAPILL